MLEIWLNINIWFLEIWLNIYLVCYLEIIWFTCRYTALQPPVKSAHWRSKLEIHRPTKTDKSYTSSVWSYKYIVKCKIIDTKQKCHHLQSENCYKIHGSLKPYINFISSSLDYQQSGLLIFFVLLLHVYIKQPQQQGVRINFGKGGGGRAQSIKAKNYGIFSSNVGRPVPLHSITMSLPLSPLCCYSPHPFVAMSPPPVAMSLLGLPVWSGCPACWTSRRWPA